MNETDNTIQILEGSRFWIQRVLVPMVVCIGVIGNTVTVMVLTRRRMRSSTNIYLSALAIADVIHNLFVLLLSIEHYPNIHEKKYELYWRFFGLMHWLCDAASSTSVWLTVSFTVERYIAVCHPIKGKVFCTENRAKSLITIVYIFCLLTTASTTFEYQLSFTDICIKECPLERIKKTHQSSENQVPPPPLQNVMEDENSTLATKLTMLENGTTNGTECCHKKYFIHTERTSLGNNITYTTFISWYSAIFFAIFPLILISTFNFFLIRAVYYSQKMRKDMMNNSQENITMSNENRITLMLIGVILMFIICQTPTAFYLMYTNIHEPQTARATRIQLIAGNICNFLLVINASSNFVLYCVLSKKFRSTFKKLFCERRKKQQDTIVLTNRSSQKFNPYKHGIRRNASEYHTPRNLETQSLTGIPRSKSLMMRPAGRAKSSDLIV